MLTKQLITPSYQCIRLMTYLYCIPVSLNMKNWHLSRRDDWKTAIIHNTLFGLGILKALHLIYALASLMLEFNSELFATIILTWCWLSFFATSMYWSWELFHRGLEETIVLFNDLKFHSSDDGTRSAGIWKWDESFVKNVKSLYVWLKYEIIPMLFSFTLQELMCFLTPFVINGFPPIYYLFMIIFPHWNIFVTSMVHTPDETGWSWAFGLLFVLEIITTTFMESNILFLFFFQLGMQTNSREKMLAIQDLK